MPPSSGRCPPDWRDHATHQGCPHHDLRMDRPRGADAAAFLHDGIRPRLRRHRLDLGLSLPRLAGGRDRTRRRHHRHRQCGAVAARHQDHHRHLSEAAADRHRSARQRIHLAVDVSPHPAVRPQGHRHGGDQRRRPGDLGRQGQDSEPAGVQAARRPHQVEDSRSMPAASIRSRSIPSMPKRKPMPSRASSR